MMQDSSKNSLVKRQVSARPGIAEKLKLHFGRSWRTLLCREAKVSYDTVKRYFDGANTRSQQEDLIYDTAIALIQAAEKNIEKDGSRDI